MPAGKETIRILIVDDMADMRENLRKLLSFESDFEVVGAAANGVEGIKLAKQFQPQIVLMDINMPGGVDGIAASESISQEVPTAAIIMMSVQSESDYLRRSMLAMLGKLNAEAVEEIGEAVGAALGWDQHRVAEERERALRVLRDVHQAKL